MPERFSSAKLRIVIAGTRITSTIDRLCSSGSITIWLRFMRCSACGFCIAEVHLLHQLSKRPQQREEEQSAEQQENRHHHVGDRLHEEAREFRPAIVNVFLIAARTRPPRADFFQLFFGVAVRS